MLMQPQAFYQQVVADDFLAVDGIIKRQLTSRVPLVEKIADYITSAGGKRLRPLLVLLCGKALGKEGDDLRLLAAIIEFLHTATLLHDDVVDMSGMRRGRATANAQWGNAPSVLVGDFLYSRSFEMMVELGSMPVMQILSKATRIIAEGEVLQLSKVRDDSTANRVVNSTLIGEVNGSDVLLVDDIVDTAGSVVAAHAARAAASAARSASRRCRCRSTLMARLPSASRSAGAASTRCWWTSPAAMASSSQKLCVLCVEIRDPPNKLCVFLTRKHIYLYIYLFYSCNIS